MSEEERFAMTLLLTIERRDAFGEPAGRTLDTVRAMCRDVLGLEEDA